tara:strand:- start:15 stop:326 length:312 start_codon:yes stop_codon:yes gene_type:complete
MVGCRSSGLLDASAQVVTGKCKLISIHVTSIGGPATIKVFDGTDNSGKEVARITAGIDNLTGGTPPNYIQDETLEFDMHGVLMESGIFYEETSGEAAVFINFA